MKHRNSARFVLLVALSLPTLAFAHPGHGAADNLQLAAAMLVGAGVGAVVLARRAAARARR